MVQTTATKFTMLQSMADPENAEALDAQLKNLRSKISDLGYQVDSYKTKTAAALGGGVFLLLLAAGAAYDLVASKGGIWLMLGVTRETLIWITIGLGAGAMILVVSGFRRVRRTDAGVRARLEQMELEYAELLERRKQVLISLNLFRSRESDDNALASRS